MVNKMKTLVLATTLALVSTSAFAGQNENIEACVNKVQEFTGKSVDMFDAHYKKGGWTSSTEVNWPGIKCEVIGILGSSSVQNLYVDNQHVIVDGYAGRAAKSASRRIDQGVDSAIETLEARIDILKGMRNNAEQKLKVNGADADAIEAKVNSAIERVTQ